MKSFIKQASLLGLSLPIMFATMTNAHSKDALEDKLFEEAYNYQSGGKSTQSLQKIKALLKQGAKPEKTSENGYNALNYAIKESSVDLVDLFLQGKIDVQKPLNEDGETPLLLALQKTASKPAASPEQLKIVQALIAAGAKANGSTRQGATPLVFATGDFTGKPKPVLIDMLLKAGANPKEKLPDGSFILVGSAASDLDSLKMLIAAGADPYAVAGNGLTPLHRVCSRHDSVQGPDPQAAERVKLLVNPKADINAFAANSQVGTPLKENILSKNPDCIQALIDAGANVNAIAVNPKFSDNGEKLSVLASAVKYQYASTSVLDILKKAEKKMAK